MHYQPSIHFRQNMDTLIQFPKNNDSACIKADKHGVLFTNSGSYFSRSVGFMTGTTLSDTAQVIDKTCRDILYETGNTLGQAKESGSFEKAVEAREFYLKARESLESLKEIQRVYSKRYADKESEGVKSLATVIQSFEKGLQQFEEEERAIEERVSLASSQLFKEATEEMGMSFLYLPDSVEASKAYAGIEEDKLPIQKTWWTTHGQGPTMLGKLASGYNTAKELAIGAFSPYSYTPSSNPVERGGQKRVANPGQQLGGGDIVHYIDGVGKTVPVNAIHDFHLIPGSAVNTKTLNQIKETILAQSGYFSNPELPLIIPVTFSGESVWERNHIAVILIKDNCVEYYDAKGIVSEHKPLAEGSGTLRDVLEFCKENFTKEGHIMENPYTHQFDAHNCGVFVCRHLHDRLITNTSMGTMSPEAPTLSEVEDFRKEIIKTAYPAEEKQSGQGQLYTGSKEDDF